MGQYISKDAAIAEIDKLVDKGKYHEEYDCAYRDGNNGALYALKNKLDTLEVIDPYEKCVQYASLESCIKAHAEDYSFNIESELFNQLTKEQQKLWVKEIEQACISGGYCGLNLVKDPRYKENLEVKKVDLDEETLHSELRKIYASLYDTKDIKSAKHFFELGFKSGERRVRYEMPKLW